MVSGESSPYLKFSSLWNFSILVSQPNYTDYYVEITLSEQGGKQLFVVQSARMNLEQGNHVFTPMQLQQLKPFRFSILDRSFSKYVNAADEVFPDGNYIIGYKVFATSENAVLTEVYTTETMRSVFNFVNIQLLSVMDEDTIIEKNPFFIWTPVEGNILNGGDGDGTTLFTYSIRVCKILPGQEKEQALLSNTAVFEKHDLTVSNQLYPVEATILEDNSSYVWQVSAYRQGSLAAKSDVWVFHYSDEKRKKQGQYVWMNRNIDQASCVVKDGNLLFAYEELYKNNDHVQGEIYSEWGQKIVELKTLDIPVNQGANMVSIDLCGQDILLAKGNFTLIVYNGKNEKFFLNFKNETPSCNE